MHLRSQLPMAALAAVTVVAVSTSASASPQASDNSGPSRATPTASAGIADTTGPAARGEQRAASTTLAVHATRALPGRELTRYRGALIRSRQDVTASPALAETAPTTVPMFTAPLDGSTVAGPMTLTVASSAPVVRFTDDQGLNQDVPVVGGTASWTVDTFGRTEGNHTESATDCDSTGDCATSSAQLSVQVDNGPLTLTSPSNGSTVGSSFVAAADSSGGAIVFLVDGVEVGSVDAVPYQVTVDTSSLSAGAHTLVAERCASDEADCGTSSDPVAFTVARVSPRITGIAPTTFSPNGDGRRDTTTISYALDSAQRVRWSVSTPGGTTLRGPVSLGNQSAGSHSFIFNGRTSAGRPLSSGGYVVTIDTSRTANGVTVTGHAERGLVVDVTPPAVTNRHASPATVFPVRDGYKDTTALVAHVNEQVSSFHAEVFNGAGRKVRVLSGSGGGAGLRHVTWNGRTAGGVLVPAGRYTFRFVVRDVAGNQTTTSRSAVVVSAKKLVKRSGSKTVSPYGSVTNSAIGDCSEVQHPARSGAAWKGSLSYLSNYDICFEPSSDELLASTRHAITLPAAAKYGSVKVSAYGARSVPGYNDTGFILYENASGDVTSKGGILAAAEGWHGGAQVSLTNYAQGRRFGWWAGTIDENFYDIRTFKVAYTYYVLR